MAKTLYSREMVDEICRRLATGESLLSICKDKKMPAYSTFMHWLTQYPELQDKYRWAREVQADILFEEILEIADTPEEGHTVKTTASGKTECVSCDMLQHRKLRVDSRKWYLARVLPKKYGERSSLELSGSVDIGGLLEERLKKMKEEK